MQRVVFHQKMPARPYKFRAETKADIDSQDFILQKLPEFLGSPI